MRKPIAVVLGVILAAAGCGGGSSPGAGEGSGSAAQPDAATERGGVITVGNLSWTLVPSTQCSVRSNRQINIAGHAAEDPEFEITIDYYPGGDGPIGLSGGDYVMMGSWTSNPETVEFAIDGRWVSGTGKFTVATEQGPQTVDGSFEVTC